MNSESEKESTRERLIEAAGKVFAERSFDGATIREICRRARTNIASIHYHFGDKQKLYEAVIRDVLRRWDKRWSESPPPPPSASPEERLHHFVRTLLTTEDAPPSRWRAELLKHEIVEPRSELQAVVKDAMHAPFDALEAIITDLLGRGPDTVLLHLCMFSVMGQCLFYKHVDNHLLGHFGSGVEYTPETVERLSRHIADFSLAAIQRFRENQKDRVQP